MEEFDQLVTTKQDVIYNLFNWPTLVDSKIVVIAMANTMDLPERVTIGRVRSRLGEFTGSAFFRCSTLINAQRSIRNLGTYISRVHRRALKMWFSHLHMPHSSIPLVRADLSIKRFLFVLHDFTQLLSRITFIKKLDGKKSKWTKAKNNKMPW